MCNCNCVESAVLTPRKEAELALINLLEDTNYSFRKLATSTFEIFECYKVPRRFFGNKTTRNYVGRLDISNDCKVVLGAIENKFYEYAVKKGFKYPIVLGIYSDFPAIHDI